MYFCLEDKIYARLTCSEIFPCGFFFFWLMFVGHMANYSLCFMHIHTTETSSDWWYWSRLPIVLVSLFLHSDDSGCHDPEEEISHGKVSVCVSNRHWGRPLPLQTQQRLQRIRWTHVWLWRDAAGWSLFESVPFSALYSISSPLCEDDLMCVSLIVAALFDSGWDDRCSSGPHEGAAPDRSQSHDAERQPVVHTDPWSRWVVKNRVLLKYRNIGTLLVKVLVIKG